MKSKMWLIAFAVCMGVAALSPLASSHPDGLERVAEDQGFMPLAQESPFQVIADYAFPGVESEATATIIAGLIGTTILFGAAYGIAWFIKTRRNRGEPARGRAS